MRLHILITQAIVQGMNCESNQDFLQLILVFLCTHTLSLFFFRSLLVSTVFTEYQGTLCVCFLHYVLLFSFFSPVTYVCTQIHNTSTYQVYLMGFYNFPFLFLLCSIVGRGAWSTQKIEEEKQGTREEEKREE